MYGPGFELIHFILVCRGHVVIWDDGQLGSLKQSLGGITSIQGSLVIIGALGEGGGNTTGLTSLDGLQNLQVGSSLSRIAIDVQAEAQ